MPPRLTPPLVMPDERDDTPPPLGREMLLRLGADTLLRLGREMLRVGGV